VAQALSPGWSGTDVRLADVEEQVRALFAEMEEDTEAPEFRTRVMTHCAWVPPEWLDRARETLAGLAEQHPSRSIILVPEPEATENRLDAEVRLQCYAMEGMQQNVCSEVIELHLRGDRAQAPASVVLPLLVSDLPAFLRWRGQPPFGTGQFESLVDVVDRLIVDSTEWPDLPDAYAELAQVFDRTVVSDIAWARTSRWRRQLASLWPGIAEVKRIRVEGTQAQAYLLAGWLRSRLHRRVEVEHVPADRLVGVEVDGEPAPFPPGDRPPPSELLSDELETFDRNRVYEDAVRAAVES
jgi:Glucose-6-phosphate dehydrogenase subunit